MNFSGTVCFCPSLYWRVYGEAFLSRDTSIEYSDDDASNILLHPRVRNSQDRNQVPLHEQRELLVENSEGERAIMVICNLPHLEERRHVVVNHNETAMNTSIVKRRNQIKTGTVLYAPKVVAYGQRGNLSKEAVIIKYLIVAKRVKMVPKYSAIQQFFKDPQKEDDGSIVQHLGKRKSISKDATTQTEKESGKRAKQNRDLKTFTYKDLSPSSKLSFTPLVDWDSEERMFFSKSDIMLQNPSSSIDRSEVCNLLCLNQAIYYSTLSRSVSDLNKSFSSFDEMVLEWLPLEYSDITIVCETAFIPECKEFLSKSLIDFFKNTSPILAPQANNSLPMKNEKCFKNDSVLEAAELLTTLVSPALTGSSVSPSTAFNTSDTF